MPATATIAPAPASSISRTAGNSLCMPATPTSYAHTVLHDMALHIKRASSATPMSDVPAHSMPTVPAGLESGRSV